MLKLISCGTTPMQDLATSSCAVDVVAEHLDRAAGLVDERGDDADERGLAGAVRTQQREEIALLDLEIDTFERLDAVFVDLGELAKDEGLHRSRVD